MNSYKDNSGLKDDDWCPRRVVERWIGSLFLKLRQKIIGNEPAMMTKACVPMNNISHLKAASMNP